MVSLKTREHELQWESEICLDFEWSIRGWVENGLDFEWHLKSGQMASKKT